MLSLGGKSFAVAAVLLTSWANQAFSQEPVVEKPPTRFQLPAENRDAFAALAALERLTQKSGGIPEKDTEVMGAIQSISELEQTLTCDRKGNITNLSKQLQTWILSLDGDSLERLSLYFNGRVEEKLKAAMESGDPAQLAKASEFGRSYFYTKAGAQALSLYASYLVGRTQYLSAAAQFHELLQLQDQLFKALKNKPELIKLLQMTPSAQFNAAIAFRRSRDFALSEKVFMEAFGEQGSLRINSQVLTNEALRKELNRGEPSAEWLARDLRKKLFGPDASQTEKLLKSFQRSPAWLQERIKSSELHSRLPSLFLTEEELFEINQFIDIASTVSGQTCKSGYALFTSFLSGDAVPKVATATGWKDVWNTTGKTQRLAKLVVMGDAGGDKTKAAINSMIELFADDDLDYHASYAIAAHKSEAVPALVKALERKEMLVRKWSASTLGKIGERMDEAALQKALPALGVALKDESVEVRRAAGWSIFYTGATNVIANQLAESLQDSNAEVRRYAAMSFGSLKTRDEVALCALTQRLLVETDRDVLIALRTAYENLEKLP